MLSKEIKEAKPNRPTTPKARHLNSETEAQETYTLNGYEDKVDSYKGSIAIRQLIGSIIIVVVIGLLSSVFNFKWMFTDVVSYIIGFYIVSLIGRGLLSWMTADQDSIGGKVLVVLFLNVILIAGLISQVIDMPCVKVKKSKRLKDQKKWNVQIRELIEQDEIKDIDRQKQYAKSLVNYDNEMADKHNKIEEIENGIQSNLAKLRKFDILPWTYLDPFGSDYNAIYYIQKYFKDQRVDSIKEGINLYVMETRQNAQYEMQNSYSEKMLKEKQAQTQEFERANAENERQLKEMQESLDRANEEQRRFNEEMERKKREQIEAIKRLSET